MKPILLAALFPLLACAAPIETPDVIYDPRFGAATSMDIYQPEPDGAAHAAVLMIHGGSWVGGNKGHFVADARRLARSGFVAASIDYRLVPDGQFPKNLQDCTCALAYLRNHATEYGIDPARIAVMGYSAGGHLASLVGLESDTPDVAPDCAEAGGVPVARPAAVIAAAGPQDMVRFWDEASDKTIVNNIFGGTPAVLPDAYWLGSPSQHVAPGAPPYLLLEDAIDFGGIVAMRDALVDAGNDAHLLQVSGSLHILEQHDDPGELELGMSTETPEAWIAVEDFLFRTIAKGGTP